MSTDTLGLEFYLTIRPKNSTYLRHGLRTPTATKGKPDIRKGDIALRLRLEVPVALFSEFIPTGTITVPADASIGRPAIEVHVPDGVEVRPDVRLALVPWPEDEGGAE
jgi:hypothetical protein